MAATEERKIEQLNVEEAIEWMKSNFTGVDMDSIETRMKKYHVNGADLLAMEKEKLEMLLGEINKFKVDTFFNTIHAVAGDVRAGVSRPGWPSITLTVNRQALNVNPLRFVQRGSAELVTICREANIVPPMHFAWVRGEVEWRVRGSVSEEILSEMRRYPNVNITDKNSYEAMHRVSQSISRKFSELELAASPRDFFDLLEARGKLKKVEWWEILKFCGISSVVKTTAETRPLLEHLHACFSEKERKMQADLMEVFESEMCVLRTCKGITEPVSEVPATQVPHGARVHDLVARKHAEFCAFLANTEERATPENAMEVDEKSQWFEDRSASNTSEKAKDPKISKSKPDLTIETSWPFVDSMKFDWFVMELQSEKANFSWHQLQMRKFLLEMLRVQTRIRAFAFGILVRGKSRYQMFVQTREDVLLVSNLISIFSQTMSLPHLLTTLMHRSTSAINLGLVPSTLTYQYSRLVEALDGYESVEESDMIVVDGYVRSGGQSSIFKASSAECGDPYIVKFVRQPGAVQNIIDAQTKPNFSKIGVSYWGYDRLYNAFIYPVLVPAETQQLSAQTKDCWFDFVARLWEFHDTSGLVHMDISPHNFLIDDQEKIYLNDWGSCVDENSSLKDVVSTVPFFDVAWLSRPADKRMDYVMLLRSIQWFLIDDYAEKDELLKEKSFFEHCQLGLCVGSLDELCEQISLIFREFGL